jgi:predicted transcriptional regulator
MTLSKKETRELSDQERWQVEEIKKGIAEADAGDFATDEEVQQTFRRLTRGRQCGPKAKGIIPQNLR